MEAGWPSYDECVIACELSRMEQWAGLVAEKIREEYWQHWNIDDISQLPPDSFQLVRDPSENEAIWNDIVLRGMEAFLDSVPGECQCQCPSYPDWTDPRPDLYGKGCRNCWKSIPQRYNAHKKIGKITFDEMTRAQKRHWKEGTDARARRRKDFRGPRSRCSVRWTSRT